MSKPVQSTELLSEVQRARRLTEAERYADARRVLERVRAEAARHEIRSAFLEWALAVSYDGLGDLGAALDHARRAVAMDPLAPPYHRSVELIGESARRALADPKGWTAQTEGLYAAWQQVASPEAAPHVSMARQLSDRGRWDEAQRVLEAVTVLIPTSADAWGELERIALLRGDGDTALRARIEKTAVGETDPLLARTLRRGIA